MRLSLRQLLSDEKQMMDYLCERLPNGHARIVLAAGEDGETWAELWADWDDRTGWHLLMERSDDHVTVEDVYDHFRRKEMTHTEWQREYEWRLFRSRLPRPEGEQPKPECRYLTAQDIMEHYQGKVSLRLAYEIMDECQPVRAGKKRLVTADSFWAYLQSAHKETPPPAPALPQPRTPATNRRRGQLPAEGFEFFRFPH